MNKRLIYLCGLFLTFFYSSLFAQNNSFFNLKSNATDDIIWSSFEDEQSNYIFIVSKKSLNSNTGVVYKTTVSGQLLDSLVLPFTQNHTLSSGFYFNNNYYFSGYIDDGNCAKILLIKTDKHFNVKETKIYHNNILEIGEGEYPFYFKVINDTVFVSGTTQISGNALVSNGFVYQLNADLDSINSRYFITPDFQMYWDIIKVNNEYRFFYDDYYQLSTDEMGARCLRLDNNLQTINSFNLRNKTTVPEGFIPNIELMYQKQAINLNDSTYLLSGRFSASSTAPHKLQTMHGVFKLNFNSGDTIVNTLILGKKDTLNSELKSSIDFKYKNNIYIGTNSQLVNLSDFSLFKNNYGLITKIDENLNVVWRKQVGGDAFYVFNSVTATSDYGVLISGHVYNKDINSNNERDVVVFKLDKQGNFVVAVGVNDINKTESQIKIYPNPSNDIINVNINTMPTNQFSYNLFNNIGQSVLQGEFKLGVNTFNISNLEKGIYYIRITNNTESLIEKIIKQ